MARRTPSRRTPSRKDPFLWEARRRYMLKNINEKLKEYNYNIVFTMADIDRGLFKFDPVFAEIKWWLAEELLFCSYSSIHRYLQPLKTKE